MASSTTTGKKIELPGRESNPGIPLDCRGNSPLYYRGFHDIYRLRVNKISMILK